MGVPRRGGAAWGWVQGRHDEDAGCETEPLFKEAEAMKKMLDTAAAIAEDTAEVYTR